MDYQTLKIKSSYCVEVVNSREDIALSDAINERIDAIWQEESRHSNLFNGSFLSAISFDNQKLKGAFVPYKHFIAQLKDPSLKPLLKIIPVSISGLTLIGENVVFAKRSSYVTQFQNCYELAPSGGIDKEHLQENCIDLRSQVKKELEEELGMSGRKVKTIKFFALVFDQKNEAIDLCAEIRVHPYAIHAQTLEYSQVITVPIHELATFVKMDNETFVPLSLLMLHLRKYLA